MDKLVEHIYIDEDNAKNTNAELNSVSVTHTHVDKRNMRWTIYNIIKNEIDLDCWSRWEYWGIKYIWKVRSCALEKISKSRFCLWVSEVGDGD